MRGLDLFNVVVSTVIITFLFTVLMCVPLSAKKRMACAVFCCGDKYNGYRISPDDLQCTCFPKEAK